MDWQAEPGQGCLGTGAMRVVDEDGQAGRRRGQGLQLERTAAGSCGMFCFLIATDSLCWVLAQ